MNQQVLDFIEVNRIMKDYFSIYMIENNIIRGKIYEDFLERFAVIGNGVNFPIFDRCVVNTVDASSKLKDFKKTKSTVTDDAEKLFFDIHDKDETYYAINKAANPDDVLNKMKLKFFNNKDFITSCQDMTGYIKLNSSTINSLISKEPAEMMIDGHYVVITGYTICPAVNEFSKIYIKYLKDISTENGEDSKYYFVIKEEIYKDFKKASRGVTHLLDVYTLMANGPLIEV